jgi:pimeloyl-ACP methyl ester carboxylesterase
MILCQRFRGNLDDWDPAFLDKLSRNYNVITFDYTGFASSTGEPPANMFLFAKDVVDLSEALNFKRSLLAAGHLADGLLKL